MDKRTMSTRRFRWGCAFLSGAFLAATIGQAAMVELNNGRTIEGSDIRAKPNGEVSLTTAQGLLTFTREQYKRAVADKPAEIDKGIAAVRAKQYDEAVGLFEDVIKRYRYLDWDNQARVLLAKTYVEKGDHAEAAKAYELLIASDPSARENPTVVWDYRKALLDSAQFAKLLPQLDKVIQEGARDDAARAQIMRGDVEMAQGNAENAALDYLRTVILFEAQTEQQPEALYKAALALTKLRDARGKELAQRLRNEYPNSPYAQQPLNP